MRVTLAGSILGLALAACGSSQIMAVEFARDPNPSAHYICTPVENEPPEEGATLSCESGQEFHQPDFDLKIAGPDNYEVSTKPQFKNLKDEIRSNCEYGVARLWFETDGGEVTRFQYVCATPPSNDWPDDSTDASVPTPPPPPAPETPPHETEPDGSEDP